MFSYNEIDECKIKRHNGMYEILIQNNLIKYRLNLKCTCELPAQAI